MNGRPYDALLGRFTSADILVQRPGDLQSYNRYSYVTNNPLSFVDPSGFESLVLTSEKSVTVQGLLATHSVTLTNSVGKESGTPWTGVTVTSQSRFGGEPETWTGSFSGDNRNTQAAIFLSQTPAIDRDVATAALASFVAKELALHGQNLNEKPIEQRKPQTGSDGGKIDPEKTPKDDGGSKQSNTLRGAKDSPPVQTDADSREWMYGPKDDPKVNSDGSTRPNTWTTPDEHKTQEAAQDKLDPFKPAGGRRPVTIPKGTTVQRGITPGGEGPYNGSGKGNETLTPGGLPPGSAGKWEPLPTEEELRRKLQERK